MQLIAPVIFGVAFLLGLILMPPAKGLATLTRMVDMPGKRKIHAKPIPYGGGIAVFFACGITVGLGLFCAYYVERNQPAWFPREILKLVEAHVQGALSRWKMIAGIFAGGFMVLVLGLVDDFKSVSYRVKLGVEGLAGLLLFVSGVRLTLFVDNVFFSAVITVLWVVGLTNAFNLLDNMDGLSTGVAIIAGSLLFAVAVQTYQVFVAALVLSLIGALGAFLIFNFPPASVFMGDAGSLFVGYMMAALTTAATFYQYHGGGPAFSVVMPVLILAVPLYDTASVMIIRFKSRRPLFEGDMNHFSHRLVALGMTPPQAVVTIYLTTLALGLAAILLPVLPLWGAVVVGLQAAAIVTVIVLLELAARKRIV